jgi:hypothetical protein
MDYRVDRRQHMEEQLSSIDMECKRVVPYSFSDHDVDMYWPNSWAHGKRKKGMMSLHKTITDLLDGQTDDLLVLEDDVVIHKNTMHTVTFASDSYPRDHIIRFDCWGTPPSVQAKACDGKRVVRRCWCGGTHAVFYRQTYMNETRRWLENHKSDIDCILQDHDHSLCHNANIFTINHSLSTDIPKE